MEEYLKYREWIKYIALCTYQKELELLKSEETTFIFNNPLSYKDRNDNLLIVVNFENYMESISRLYEYFLKLEKDYSICAISFLNLNSDDSDSTQFIGLLFCIPKKHFEMNIKKYETIFEYEIEQSKILKDKILKIINENKQLILEFNQIPRDELREGIKENINETYNYLLDKIIKNAKITNKEFQKKRRQYEKKQKIKLDFHVHDISDNTFFSNKDLFLESLEQIENKKQIRKVKLVKHLKYTKENIRSFLQKEVSFVVVISIKEIEKTQKIIKMLKKFNNKVEIIVVTVQKHMFQDVTVLKNNLEAEKATQGIVSIWITEDNNNFICENKILINSNDLKNVEIKEFEEQLRKNRQFLKAFANLEHKNSIKVFTGTFLNFEGTNYYSGGAERYLIDLHEVCKKIGMKLRIYQKANYEFFRYYEDIEIVGLSDHNKPYEYEYESDMEILNNYHKIAKDTTKLNLYSAFYECNGRAQKPSIGISHGVSWDNIRTNYQKGALFQNEWIVDSAISCNKMVSVDTNTANYFQTVDYELGRKIEYVPNYVNPNEFFPIPKKISNRIRIVYPRRLYRARGMYMLLDITDRLLEKYPNIEIHFVGKGFPEDTDLVKEKVNKWKDRVQMYSRSPREMHKVYKEADISLIPTLYSEGTSLSCLEAMATGNAVIATRIGGLTDLIIHNFNGKLIEPNSESLYNAIKEYLDNPEEMEYCKKNAIEVAKTFNKSIWQDRWMSLIKQYRKMIKEPGIINYNLVKIYVQKEFLDDNRLKELIYEKLLQNKVVYIITPKNPYKNYSFGRLQYIEENTELYRKADEVYIYKDYHGKIEEEDFKTIEN